MVGLATPSNVTGRCVSVVWLAAMVYTGVVHVGPAWSNTVTLYFCPLPAAMEKQVEELRQQLEKQCQINQELKRQNKDLGVRNTTTT